MAVVYSEKLLAPEPGLEVEVLRLGNELLVVPEHAPDVPIRKPEIDITDLVIDAQV